MAVKFGCKMGWNTFKKLTEFDYGTGNSYIVDISHGYCTLQE